MKKIIFGLFLITFLLACNKDEEASLDEKLATFFAGSSIDFTENPSGLYSYIADPGNQDSVPEINDLVSLVFTASSLTGEELNSSDGNALTYYFSSQNSGLREGLSKLGIGGTGQFVVPGSLSDGAVAENDAIVYDIQVQGINKIIQQEMDQHIADSMLVTQTTSEGLHYVIVEAGSTDKPSLDDNVTINYRGKLLDGSIFDQTVLNPATFGLSNLIRGWQLGIPLIGKGGKITLIIPPQLGYGPGGTSGIPGNAVLIFDVELINF